MSSRNVDAIRWGQHVRNPQNQQDRLRSIGSVGLNHESWPEVRVANDFPYRSAQTRKSDSGEVGGGGSDASLHAGDNQSRGAHSRTDHLVRSLHNHSPLSSIGSTPLGVDLINKDKFTVWLCTRTGQLIN